MRRRYEDAPRREYLTRREVRDLWYHLARMRAAAGDKAGAARARVAARAISSDSRRRHDQ